MSDTNNYGPTVSNTLPTSARAFDNIVWQQGKPPLDSELNLLSDIQSEGRRQQMADQLPSGFLKLDPFIFDPSSVNRFGLPMTKLVVNGWPINFNASGTEEIVLPDASSGLGNHRWDFVFLEVWKVMISGGSTDSKPDASSIYRDGNVQRTAGNLADDIVDPVVVIETTKRVQIQHRYRVHQGADAPDGQNANMYSAAVLAQGAMNAPIAGYPFTNMGSDLNDFGLWRAGDGTPAAHTQLGTVDGYVYSVPIAMVFRRSNAAYSDASLNGQNASAFDIASTTSDRPDGLFYDSIDPNDVIDLRHLSLAAGQSFDEILKNAVKSIMAGRNATKSPGALMYEVISETGVPGYANLNTNARADQVRTNWSDLVSTDDHVAVLHIGDTDSNRDWFTDRSAGSWTNGDEITINAPTDSPAGTVIMATPSVYYNKGGLLPVTGSWTNLGTSSATFTLGTTVGLTNENIWVIFDVQYPSDQGLTFLPDDLIKLEYVNYTGFPVVQSSYSTYYGSVRNGADLLSLDLRNSINTKQIGYEHAGSIGNFADNHLLSPNNKGIRIAPIVASNSAGNCVISVKNYQNSTKKIWLPLPTDRTWFVRGVYTSASINPANEKATISLVAQVPGAIDNTNRTFSIPAALTSNSFAEVTQISYLPGSQNLIGTLPGEYKPVFRQSANGHIDKVLLTRNSDGAVFVPSSLSTNPGDYRITFRHIATASVNAYVADDEADNNFVILQNTFSTTDGSELFIDMDYISPTHADAQLKMVYRYLPYQGLADGLGTELKGSMRALTGLIHSDGTGNDLSNMNRTSHPRALSSYFPTPTDLDAVLDGSDISGAYFVGKFGGLNLPFTTNVGVIDLSEDGTVPLTAADIVGVKFNGAHASMERGVNEVTESVEAMLPNINNSNPHQAVVFGLMLARDNMALQNELVLMVLTNTLTSQDNEFQQSNTTTLGADVFFIPGRPLIKN